MVSKYIQKKGQRLLKKEPFETDPFIESEKEINLTSMIDMMFILLIFIMVSAQFTKKHHFLHLQLPRTQFGEKQKNHTITIIIERDGNLILNGSRLTFPDLQKKVTKRLFQNRGVTILSAADAPFGVFARLISYLKEGNCKNIQIGTDIKKYELGK